MSITIQLISLLIYFIFGIVLYILGLINNKLSIKLNIIIVFSVFLIFTICNYHINLLVIHPYFIMSTVFGLLFSKIYVNKEKKHFHL